MDYFSTLISIGGMIQSKNQHSQEIETNYELTRNQLNESNRLHQEQIILTNQLHNIQHNHNKVISDRECLRDVWDQKNHKTHTLIITLSLLYSCCFIIIIEGDIDKNVNKIVLNIYQIFLSIALITTSSSLLLLIKLQSKMTNFNIFDRNHIYDCGQTHINFESYYNHHCKKIKTYAIKCYYIGLISIYITSIIFWSCKLYYTFKNLLGLIIFIFINTIGIICIIFILKL